MILAAQHPNYLPLWGFFYEMSQADIFVLVDDFQYTKHNYINRTKIKTAQGFQWLTVPVFTKGQRRQLIHQVKVDVSQNWRRKHWKTLFVNYKYAAYFEEYANFFENVYNTPWSYLIDLNLEIIEFIRNKLNISTRVYLSSALNVSGKGNRRLLNILEKLSCETYLSYLDRKSDPDQQVFEKSGIKIKFISSKLIFYHQQFADFISNLSIIDLLFNEGEMSHNILLNT